MFTLAEASAADGQSVILTNESGGEWRPVDNALASLDGSGRTLPQVASRDAYWFSSYVFTLIWTSTPRILCPLPPSCCAWTAPFTRYLVVYIIDTNLKLILN